MSAVCSYGGNRAFCLRANYKAALRENIGLAQAIFEILPTVMCRQCRYRSDLQFTLF